MRCWASTSDADSRNPFRLCQLSAVWLVWKPRFTRPLDDKQTTSRGATNDDGEASTKYRALVFVMEGPGLIPSRRFARAGARASRDDHDRAPPRRRPGRAAVEIVATRKCSLCERDVCKKRPEAPLPPSHEEEEFELGSKARTLGDREDAVGAENERYGRERRQRREVTRLRRPSSTSSSAESRDEMRENT